VALKIIRLVSLHIRARRDTGLRNTLIKIVSPGNISKNIIEYSG
jgi:hypothetical protein